jgi:hypothetical protein
MGFTARSPFRRAARLVDRHAFDEQDVTEFFAKLAPYMEGAVTADSIWITRPKNTVTSSAPGRLRPKAVVRT